MPPTQRQVCTHRERAGGRACGAIPAYEKPDPLGWTAYTAITIPGTFRHAPDPDRDGDRAFWNLARSGPVAFPLQAHPQSRVPILKTKDSRRRAVRRLARNPIGGKVDLCHDFVFQ